MNYVVGGQASIDRVILPNGECIGTNLGGPCLFAYTGIRVWSDSCQMILNAAEDFKRNYGEWVELNSVSTEQIQIVFDYTHSSNLIYNKDGSYIPTKLSAADWQRRNFNYGWTNVRPEQVDAACDGAKGFCLFVEPTFQTFWRRINEIKQRRGFKMMWEIGASACDAEELESIKSAIDTLKPEMASLNHNEASKLFGTDDMQQLFAEIRKFNTEMFFYRCGSKGSYVILKNSEYFIPSIDIDNQPCVDPTGCGNNSTAASMYAWIETQNPVMTGIIANISAGFNALQGGLIPHFTTQQRSKAVSVAVERYNDYIMHNPEYAALGYPEHGEDVLKDIVL